MKSLFYSISIALFCSTIVAQEYSRQESPSPAASPTRSPVYPRRSSRRSTSVYSRQSSRSSVHAERHQEIYQARGASIARSDASFQGSRRQRIRLQPAIPVAINSSTGAPIFTPSSNNLAAVFAPFTRALRATSLHEVAALGSYGAVVNFISVNGTDSNVPDEHGRTPLHYAVTEHNLSTVPALLNFGANPNRQDNAGNTPLHNAAQAATIEVMNLLIQSGARLDLANNNNRTPLNYLQAQSNITEETLQTLGRTHLFQLSLNPPIDR